MSRGTAALARRRGNSTKQHAKLHLGVWVRIIAIVVAFTVILLVIRIGSLELNNETRGSSSIRNDGRKSGSGHGAISFATIVMPSVVKPEARPLRLANIAKTWGAPSRAVYVVHSTDEYPPGELIGEASNNMAYPQNILVPAHITVDKGVERLIYVIRAVHKLNLDFAFFVNDHTFVLPDHLCQFLNQHDSSKDLYAGHALKGKGETVFNSGAAGYVLSRSTMERLIRELDKPASECSPENVSKWLHGNPGLLTAQCFVQVLDIPVVDTRDKKDLSHKFHAYGLVRTVMGEMDEWYFNKHQLLDGVLGEDKKFHHRPQPGVQCCSDHSISFHYVEAAESLAFWEVLESVHRQPIMSDEDIVDLMHRVWPSLRQGPEGYGAYAHALPMPDSDIWKDIVQVVKKISNGVNNPPSC
ncbi:hypothetical protein ACHAWF_013148 [Thalassiosira exigua]